MAQTSRSSSAVKVVVALVFLFIAIACVIQGAEVDKVVKETWGAAVEGQALSISTEKSTYAPGERIALDVRFKNVGRKDVEIVKTNPLQLYHVDVLLPDGKSTPLTLSGEAANELGARSVGILKPGQESRTQFDLSERFDLSLAGTYTVSLERFVSSKDGGSGVTLKAKSNKLKIAIDESLRPAAAGAAPEGGKTAEKTWGSAVEGQAVSIMADKPAYNTGEPVALRICFKNVGQQDVEAARKDPLRTYLLTVLDPDGKPAHLTLFGKEAIKPDGAKNLEKLAPGEEICDELKLNRLFDLTLAGEYTVSVQRPVWTDGALSSTLKATSNKLRIKR